MLYKESLSLFAVPTQMLLMLQAILITHISHAFQYCDNILLNNPSPRSTTPIVLSSAGWGALVCDIEVIQYILEISLGLTSLVPSDSFDFEVSR